MIQLARYSDDVGVLQTILVLLLGNSLALSFLSLHSLDILFPGEFDLLMQANDVLLGNLFMITQSVDELVGDIFNAVLRPLNLANFGNIKHPTFFVGEVRDVTSVSCMHLESSSGKLVS